MLRSMTVLLPNTALMKSIRVETTPLFEVLVAKRGQARITELARVEIFCDHVIRSCSLLNSFNEVVRAHSTGTSVHHTTREVTIAGNRVPAGCDIIIPHRQLLVDPNAFGEDAHVINPERFLNGGKRKSKNLEHHSSYRHFGGGTTMFSG